MQFSVKRFPLMYKSFSVKYIRMPGKPVPFLYGIYEIAHYRSVQQASWNFSHWRLQRPWLRNIPAPCTITRQITICAYRFDSALRQIVILAE